MPPPQDLVLFYDALCPLCRRAVKRLAGRRLLEGIEVRPTDDAASLGLSQEDLDAVRSQMLLRDSATGESHVGFEAILKLVEVRDGPGSWLARLGRAPPVAALGTFLYRLIAYNRRVLSPPATGGAACACDPPPRPGWRAALAAALVLQLALCLLVFGAGLSPELASGRVWAWVGEALATGALACGAPGLLAALARPSRARDVLWQSLAASAFAGAWLAMAGAVGMVLAVVAPSPAPVRWWAVAGVILVVAQTAAMLGWRHRHLGLPGWLSWAQVAGVAAIWAGALGRWGIWAGTP